MIYMMEAPVYKCFDVIAVNKLTNTPIEMGISGNKVVLTPKSSQSRSPTAHFTDRLLSRFQPFKALSVDIENVIDCTVLPMKQCKSGFDLFSCVYKDLFFSVSERKLCKLVYYNGTDFKSIKFESDADTIDEIVFKLRNVMKMRTSLRRNEYQSHENRKKSLSSKIYFKTRISSGSESDADDSKVSGKMKKEKSPGYQESDIPFDFGDDIQVDMPGDNVPFRKQSSKLKFKHNE